jgi:pyruvate kinase
MLSGESASGQYPGRIREDASRDRPAMEEELPYEQLAKAKLSIPPSGPITTRSPTPSPPPPLLIGAKLIINFTQTGNSTKRISKARPCCPIISVTNNRKTGFARRLALGRLFVLIKTSMPDFIEEMEVFALKIARDLGIEAGSPIIIAGGTPTGAGKTNFMRIVNVNQIKDLD